jgi:PIN domain nuclease of toxin-antitoxin system
LTVALDAWAVMAYLKGEAQEARVRPHVDGRDATISAINLGEALYNLIRSHGEVVARDRIERLRTRIDVEDPDWSLVQRAARLKAQGGLSYSDCFALATAERHRVPLLTGDPEILEFAGDIERIDLRAP